MWGGHYENGPAAVMARINECLEVDRQLYEQDIAGSLAHVAMLAKQKIIPASDARIIRTGLLAIQREISNDQFTFKPELEDIHMNIEMRLHELIGPAAGRLHTARSRNDQVATDLRLWVRQACDELAAELQLLMNALLDQAECHATTLMPGYTHLQPAQPVTFGHHLMAYVEMFGRDLSRLKDARCRMNECPLGAAALAGTSYPIDRQQTAAALAFDTPMANSLDAVSDRDFALEFANVAALAGLHLSRLAEEIILWASSAFRFIKLPESFTTGSSIMPQKRNPDAAELIRGKSASLIAAQQQLQILVKGLPLAYNKDLQESKAPVMAAAQELRLMLHAMRGMISALEPNTAAMAEAAQQGFLTATDIADYLVRNHGLPFREAHHVTGRIVKLAEKRNFKLAELELDALRRVYAKIGAEIYDLLDPAKAVRTRTSYGGTAPQAVKAQIQSWRKQLRKRLQ